MTSSLCDLVTQTRFRFASKATKQLTKPIFNLTYIVATKLVSSTLMSVGMDLPQPCCYSVVSSSLV